MSKRTALISSVVLSGAVLVTATVLLTRPVPQRQGFLVGAKVDPKIRAILERSCADCHSDTTHYPWYAFLPVIADTIRDDVARGREQLNLSRWGEYSRLRQQRSLTGIANQVKDRAMPLPEYLLLHPSARLSDADVTAIFEWAQEERLRLILEAAGKVKPPA